MKSRSLFLLAFIVLCLVCGAHAQDMTDPGPGSVTVFSEDGEKFTLFLNGDQKNGSTASRVEVPNVSEVPVSFRLVFEDGTEVKRNGMRQGTNCLYVVAKNKKGERVLRMKDCSGEAVQPATRSEATVVTTTDAPVSTPDQLSAKYADNTISINDGRTLSVKKVKAHGMTYPQVIMTALTGAKVTITYDDNDEKYSAETPFKYEVKDFSNNNAYFKLTVDEGGPAKTWSVKLQHSNGYDLRIE